MTRTQLTEATGRRVAAFLRDHQRAIFDAWRSALDTPARAGTERTLADFIPTLIERIAQAAERISLTGPPVLPPDVVDPRTLDRLAIGLAPRLAVEGIVQLREAMQDQWRARGVELALADQQLLQRAIDALHLAMVDHYAARRDRLMCALDRISTVSLEAAHVDGLLAEWLEVLRDAMPGVGAAGIVLLEDDALRVCASFVRRDPDDGRPSDGARRHGEPPRDAVDQLVAQVSRQRSPVYVEEVDRGSQAQVVGMPDDGAHARTLYGVPLLAGGQLRGVAYIAARDWPEIPAEDRQLFDLMVKRASASLRQHMLRVTAEQRATQLAESRARMEAIFENAAAGIAEVALDGTWLRVNPTYERILGYAPEALIGRHAAAVLHPDDLEPLQEAASRVLSGESDTARMDVRHLRPDGTLAWLDVWLSMLLDANGQPTQYIAVSTDITDRKRAEEALRRSESRLRLALEATDLGTWEWELATGELSWSPRCTAILGLPPDAVPGVHILPSLLSPEERRIQLDLIAAALHPESSGRFAREHPLHRADTGEARWVAVHGQADFDAHGRPQRLTGTLLDITDRKRAEAHLRFLSDASKLLVSGFDYDETLAQLARLAVPAVADACLVCVLDQTGDEPELAVVTHADVDVSARVQRQVDAAIEEGREPALGERLATLEARICSGPTRSQLARWVRDPALRRVFAALDLRSLLVVPFTGHARHLGFSILAYCASGRHFAPDDVRMYDDLGRRVGMAIDNARLYAKSRRAVQLRERILALVSHDLRSPLGTIGLSASMLAALPGVQGDAKARKQVEIVRRSADRMQRLIGDLLDLSSIQAGRLAIRREPCSVTALLHEAADVHEPLARDRGIHLRRSTDVERDVITCDRDRILQALSNLLGNAIKFCLPGDTIVLCAEQLPEGVRMSVTDTGPGIAPEHLAHIFDPYTKATAREAKRGTGLGLSIAKGIVETHGGRIGVKSRPNVGSTFWLTLPADT